MSEEMQENLDQPEEIQEEQEIESSESSPETGESEESSQPQKVEFSPEQQEILNTVIGKKTAQMREMERRAIEAERQAKELKSQLPQDERPNIPAMPDAYDDDYEQKVAARDEAIKNAAAWDAKQELENQHRLQQAHQQQLKEQERLVSMVKTYDGRAKELGIQPDQLQAAGAALQQHGLRDELAEFILNDEHGPLITMHLASNPLAVEELRGLTPMQQAVHLTTNLKPKLLSGAKKQSSAPPPPETLGSGGAPKSERGPKGATFE